MPPADEPRSARELEGSDCPTVRALGAYAAASPVEPCVFFQEGIDWRWTDWRTLARRVLAAARGLEDAASLANRVVGFPSSPGLDTLVLDLALRHCGAVPRPRGAGDSPLAGDTWIAEPRDPVVAGEAVVLTVEDVERWRADRAGEVAAIAAGCEAPLLERARLVSRLRRSPPREVVADVLELERPLCRAGVSWTLECGGALVLAHERPSLDATARWARPTRLWAETSGQRFERLADAVLGRARAGLRLVSALWSGAEPPAAAIVDALAAAGVEVACWRPSERAAGC
ncbi:MAG TPA: hypothetical protein VMT85_03475 [Thermoanaerobaculia bacterium]|nr:hypothetical protein [Thermoanaerobaculia bacterium]